jgi:hypothetical protein
MVSVGKRGEEGTRYNSWLRRYAASRKVPGSNPDEVIGFFFSNLPISPLTQCPGVYSASNRNVYQKMFLRSKALPVRKDDNLTAMCC